MVEVIEVLQIVGWLIAIVFSFVLRNLLKESIRAWSLIGVGAVLFFLRVTWKFTPLYAGYVGNEIRYLLGIAAAFVLLFGFLDYYATVVGLKGGA